MNFERLTNSELERVKEYAKSVAYFCESGIELSKNLGSGTSPEYIKGAESVIAILKGDVRNIEEILEDRK